MKSILCVMAIESLAPQVRTVVEVNNPSHVEHFQRADADEILVSSQLVSRLMARSSLYPGLAGLVTDIVSGGEGSELYRVAAARRLRRPLGRRALGQAPRRAPRHAALGQPRRAVLRQPARGLPARPRATTWSWSPSHSATSRRCRWTTTSAASSQLARLSPAAPRRSRRRCRPSTSPRASRRRRRRCRRSGRPTSSSGPAFDDRERSLVVAPDRVDEGYVGRARRCPAPGRWSAATPGRRRCRTRGRRRCRRSARPGPARRRRPGRRSRRRPSAARARSARWCRRRCSSAPSSSAPR